MENIKNTIKPIRSYVLRQGRLTKHQADAIENFGDELIIPFSEELIRWESIFSLQKNEVLLEIGFGMGDSTAEIALNTPQKNFIGIEVHSPGVGNLINRIKEYDISNLKIIQHDAVEIIEKMIANRSLDGIHIFFPDPWHKKRHNKRRLIKADFLNKLALKLKEQAYIHIATDWEDYAHWILDESMQCKNLCLKGNEFHNKPDYRPYTKYEKRGVNLGHKVWDIIFLKC
jgi:tRNA (guanine-N7-)-methyltransferase